MNHDRWTRLAELAGAVALATFLSVAMTDRVRVEPAGNAASAAHATSAEELACFDVPEPAPLAAHYDEAAAICRQ